MSMHEELAFVPAEAPAGSWGVQVLEIDLSQLTNKGFGVIIGAGKAFTASLDASVARQNWTQIHAMGTSGQGTIATHYNYVRLNITGAGAIGTATRVVVSGTGL